MLPRWMVMSEKRAIRRLRSVSVGLLSAVLLMGTVVGASAADDEQPSGPPEAPEGIGAIEDFVARYDGGEFIRRFEGGPFIARLGSRVPEETAIIVLETDILFPAMEWELPEGAGPAIADLAEEVPEGATVAIHGHTDSNPVPESYDFDNQELSENRAQAVADALAEERPDLQLSVEGFGDSNPAVEEDEEDPSTFAANRRVEIRYG